MAGLVESTASSLSLIEPCLDLTPEPELRPSAASVEHGTGHVGVTLLVQVDISCMREAHQRGDVVRIN